MKKIRNLPESQFLKLFFLVTSLVFLAAAFCMPDRASMFQGFLDILVSPCKVTTNYFSIGGFAGTFLNAGLVGLAMVAVFHFTGAKVNNGSTLAFLLTLGFCTWGINLLNMWFTVLGVVVYTLVKREKLGANANAMFFSTGIAPIISELLLRYPGAENPGFSLVGFVLALVVGVAIGFFLPAGLAHSPNVHKGFDLYSAAVPIGMTAFLLNAVFYKAPGVALPGTSGDMAVASAPIVNIFCMVFFGICVVLALLMGCTPKDYWILLKDPDQVTSFSSRYGNHVMLMNVGIYGLFILGYYNLIGAPFNGVTFGIIFCMLACCNSGFHPGNVWPIMAGYILASFLFGWIAKLTGGDFTLAINAQAIVIGLCYANGLSPIADKYGWAYGLVAAVLHYCMVTIVPSLHGGFCLYNGGFTAALVCLILVPELERLFKTKEQKKALKK